MHHLAEQVLCLVKSRFDCCRQAGADPSQTLCVHHHLPINVGQKALKDVILAHLIVTLLQKLTRRAKLLRRSSLCWELEVTSWLLVGSVLWVRVKVAVAVWLSSCDGAKKGPKGLTGPAEALRMLRPGTCTVPRFVYFLPGPAGILYEGQVNTHQTSSGLLSWRQIFFFLVELGVQRTAQRLSSLASIRA